MNKDPNKAHRKVPLVTPAVHLRHKEQLLEQQEIFLRQQKEELRRIVLSEGYKYARNIASVIQAEYMTRPPKTDEEKTKWQTYCCVKWAIDKVFSEIEKIADINSPSDQPRQIT